MANNFPELQVLAKYTSFIQEATNTSTHLGKPAGSVKGLIREDATEDDSCGPKTAPTSAEDWMRGIQVGEGRGR